MAGIAWILSNNNNVYLLHNKSEHELPALAIILSS